MTKNPESHDEAVSGKTEMLDYRAFKELLMDFSVSDKEVARYLTVDSSRGGPFDPYVVPDPDKVDLSPRMAAFDLGSPVRWANGSARWRRQRRFVARLRNNDLPVLVSEGDSWFQFPFFIEDVIDHLDSDYLIWSLDAAGDTADNMVNRRPEYMKALQEQKGNHLQAFLFSAAGNDVIGQDARGEPVLKTLIKPYDPKKDAAWHIDHAALAKVLTFLERAYIKVISTVRSDPELATLPILVHGYDYARPGGRPGDNRDPAWAAPDKWLGRALRDKGLGNPLLQDEVLRVLIDSTYDMLIRVALATSYVYVVDVRGALPNISDWADEIHPTDAGFEVVADRFRQVLSTVPAVGLP